MRYSVALASHNRMAGTIRSLETLFAAAEKASATVDVTLYDDSSDDGTPQEVANLFPFVNVIAGSGEAYWGGGMALAEEQARQRLGKSPKEYVVWLNDDVELDESVFCILEKWSSRENTILVGATRSRTTLGFTYGGYRRNIRHPLSFERVQPNPSEVTPIDAFNGNFVVIPSDLAMALGGVRSCFPHALGDLDYGLRARELGAAIMLLPGYVGFCEENQPPLFRSQRDVFGVWKEFVSIKGAGYLPSVLCFLRRHSKDFGLFTLPLYYLNWWLRALTRSKSSALSE